MPGSVLRVQVDNTRPLAWGLPDEVDVFFDNSPVMRLEPAGVARGVTPVAWFDSDAPLRSGWAWGQERLQGGVAMPRPGGRGQAVPLRSRDHQPGPAPRHLQAPFQRDLPGRSAGPGSPSHLVTDTGLPGAGGAEAPTEGAWTPGALRHAAGPGLTVVETRVEDFDVRCGRGPRRRTAPWCGTRWPTPSRWPDAVRSCWRDSGSWWRTATPTGTTSGGRRGAPEGIVSRRSAGPTPPCAERFREDVPAQWRRAGAVTASGMR